MINKAITGNESESPRWRILAVLAATVVLTVQVGLVMHEASHLHDAGDVVDCTYCILAAHFLIEPVSSIDLDILGPVAIHLVEKPVNPAETIMPALSVRGPPVASV